MPNLSRQVWVSSALLSKTSFPTAGPVAFVGRPGSSRFLSQCQLRRETEPAPSQLRGAGPGVVPTRIDASEPHDRDTSVDSGDEGPNECGVASKKSFKLRPNC